MASEKLFDNLAPEMRFVPLERLPALETLNCAPPSTGFVASLKEIQLQPVVLQEEKDGGYRTIVGNRRIYAAHLGAIEGLWAWVYQPGDVNPAMMQVAENHHRSDNPFTDLDGIMVLLATHNEMEVAAALHLPVGTVRAAIKLQHLLPELLQLARCGAIAITVAIDLARKAKGVQEKVLAEAKAGEKITSALVKRCATAVVQATMPTLPIPAVVGGPGLQFGRALDAENGVKLIFFQDGAKEEYTVPAAKLYELVRA